jgi:ATP-dependent RNA helicase DDX56/DBP9
VAITLVREEEMEILANYAESIEGLPLDLAEFEGLRYRVEDVLKSAGNQKKVKTARQREIFQQILTSNKMKNTLTENEQDAKALRRAVKINAVKTVAHLKHLPNYLIPAEIKSMTLAAGTAEDPVGTHHPVVKAAKEAAATSGEAPAATTGDNAREINAGVARSFERANFAGKPKSLRDKLIARNENKAATAEDLPPISGRKLWKIKHKKALRKSRVEAGKHMRSRQAARVKKIANRFK